MDTNLLRPPLNRPSLRVSQPYHSQRVVSLTSLLSPRPQLRERLGTRAVVEARPSMLLGVRIVDDAHIVTLRMNPLLLLYGTPTPVESRHLTNSERPYYELNHLFNPHKAFPMRRHIDSRMPAVSV